MHDFNLRLDQCNRQIHNLRKGRTESEIHRDISQVMLKLNEKNERIRDVVKKPPTKKLIQKIDAKRKKKESMRQELQTLRGEQIQLDENIKKQIKLSHDFLQNIEKMVTRNRDDFERMRDKRLSDLEKEFEKNTNLMLDSFTFSVAIPGDLRNANATFISENDNTIYWEFDFNDIATSHFNMYAHSVVINNLSLQLLLLIIILGFIGFLWKKRLKKE